MAADEAFEGRLDVGRLDAVPLFLGFRELGLPLQLRDPRARITGERGIAVRLQKLLHRRDIARGPDPMPLLLGEPVPFADGLLPLNFGEPRLGVGNDRRVGMILDELFECCLVAAILYARPIVGGGRMPGGALQIGDARFGPL